MRIRPLVAVIACVLAPSAVFAQASDTVEKPSALVSDGVPAVPVALAAETRPYMEFRTASFGGWNAGDRSMLVSTRFGNTAQIHRVAVPMGARGTRGSFPPVTILTMQTFTGDVLQPDTEVVHTLLPLGSEPAVVSAVPETEVEGEA